jgi:hypothetical protein
MQGTVTSEEAAALLGLSEVKESDLVPSVYEGEQCGEGISSKKMSELTPEQRV